MNNFSFGLLILLMFVGNRFGSEFGMAVAVASFLMFDSAMGTIRKRHRIKNTFKKEEVR